MFCDDGGGSGGTIKRICGLGVFICWLCVFACVCTTFEMSASIPDGLNKSLDGSAIRQKATCGEGEKEIH